MKKVYEEIFMELVKSLEEIRHNIAVLDSYLDKKTDPEYSYALGLVKRGICFIADSSSGKYRFYPSRFIGYVDNTMDKHMSNTTKDGKQTNPAISTILHDKPQHNLQLEELYQTYCQSLGFEANEKGSRGIDRKYWLI